MAEKQFNKLRDHYARCRKALQEKNRSGTSTKAIKSASDKMKNLLFMAWINEFIKPRKLKTNIDDASTKHSNEGTQIDNGSDKSEEEEEEMDDRESKLNHDTPDYDEDSLFGDEKQEKKGKEIKVDEAVPTKSNQRAKKRKMKRSEIEKEEIEVLRSIANAAQNQPKPKEQEKEKGKDSFDLFGEYIAQKLRNLSKKLGDDEMELLEHKIRSIFVKRFANAKNPNVTPTQQAWLNYHFSNFNQSVSTSLGQKTNVSPFG